MARERVSSCLFITVFGRVGGFHRETLSNPMAPSPKHLETLRCPKETPAVQGVAAGEALVQSVPYIGLGFRAGFGFGF